MNSEEIIDTILKLKTMSNRQSNKKELKGVVKSVGMNSTVKVAVSRPLAHSKYSKIVKRSKMFLAHTTEELVVGDNVVIRESRPISKNVKWTVVGKYDSKGE